MRTVAAVSVGNHGRKTVMEVRQLKIDHRGREPHPKKRGSPRDRPIRRRWRRRLLIAAGVLFLLVAMVPWILSSSPGTSLILSLVNKKMRGKVEVQDLSLSWIGPIRLKKLRLLDPDGVEVLNVDRATIRMGLWRAIRAPQRFTQLTLDSPHIAFYEQEDGVFSLLEAIGPKEKGMKKAPPSTSKRQRPDRKPFVAKKKPAKKKTAKKKK